MSNQFTILFILFFSPHLFNLANMAWCIGIIKYFECYVMDRGHFIKKHLHPAKLSEPKLLKFALFSTEVAKYSEFFKKEAIPFENPVMFHESY